MQTDPLEPASRTRTKKQFTTDFRLPYSRVSTPPQKEHKNKTKNYEFDPTDDKEGIPTHAVE